MISSGVIAGLALSFMLSAGAPFAVYFALRRRMTLSAANIGIGAVTFFVAALVLEQTLHYFVLQANPAATAWFHANSWAYVAYAVLAAGIFEEVGRYVAMRRFVKPTGNPGTAVAYGLGHGGIEAVLLGGLSQIHGVIVAILFNMGVVAPTAPMMAAAHAQLAHLTFPLALIGGVERVIALSFQIVISLVVWRAVESKRLWLLFVAIAFHALGDLGAGLFQARVITSVYLAEVWALVVIALIVGFLRLMPKEAPA